MKCARSLMPGLLFLLLGWDVACSWGGELRLLVPRGYLPRIPVLVRVEVREASGDYQRDLWEAEAVLSADRPGIALSPDRIRLRHGLGSALVRVQGSGDFVLGAQVGIWEASRPLMDWEGRPIRLVSGVLEGEGTIWEGLIQVTGDLTVPVGHVLTIQPGSLVLVDGVATGTVAPDLLVNGRIECLGTAEEPVTITCSDPALRWGQIRHTAAEPSVYKYTIVTRGGRAPREGHTGTGPVLRPRDSRIVFEHCTISDHADSSGQPGKVMEARDSDLVFEDCLLARSRMGPEVAVTGLRCTNTFFMEMRGPDDSDGIYIHYQGLGQVVVLSRCVVVGTDDDGIDTLHSEVRIENCLVRDVFDKGVSVNSGEVWMQGCLTVACAIGVSTKTGNGATVRSHIDRSTILARDRGIASENKGGAAPDAIVLYGVTNSIVQATVHPEASVYSDYDPTWTLIAYSNVVGTNWPGVGNLNSDPLFLDPTTNFALQAASPCIDSGDPAASPDPDGTRADMGAFPFFHHPNPPRLGGPAILTDGRFAFTLLGRPGERYRIEASRDLSNWTTRETVTNLSGRVEWGEPAVGSPGCFYRVQVLAGTIP